MKDKLTIGDLYLGLPDAKYEIIGEDGQVEVFRKTYLHPENIDTQKYLNGKQYYILGLKGTGKTAFLRFLSVEVEKNKHSHEFILFKSDIREYEREKFEKTANTVLVDRDSADYDLNADFELAWRLFFHKLIVDVCVTKNINLFHKNLAFTDYIKSVQGIKTDSKASKFWKLMPTVTQGEVEVGAEYKSLTAKLRLALDFNNRDEAQIKVNEAVTICDRLLNELDGGAAPLYIFIDELELSAQSKDKYIRDGFLVRDLIITVEFFNTLARKKRIPLYLVAGIRSEVTNVISGYGKEINKILDAFGNHISWHMKGNQPIIHPLLKIVTKKLQVSEELYLKKSANHNTESIWNTYFPTRINDVESTEYVLHHSWYRPRDLVRLLKAAQNAFPNEDKFSQLVFEGVMKDFSTQSWNELSEELSASYTSKDLDGIKRMFYGFNRYFSYDALSEHINQIMPKYPSVHPLISKYGLTKIVEDLYRVGALGNHNKGKFRYVFRGDDDVILEQDLTLHRALWKHFSIV